jgi:hypothetical protein
MSIYSANSIRRWRDAQPGVEEGFGGFEIAADEGGAARGRGPDRRCCLPVRYSRCTITLGCPSLLGNPPPISTSPTRALDRHFGLAAARQNLPPSLAPCLAGLHTGEPVKCRYWTSTAAGIPILQGSRCGSPGQKVSWLKSMLAAALGRPFWNRTANRSWCFNARLSGPSE